MIPSNHGQFTTSNSITFSFFMSSLMFLEHHTLWLVERSRLFREGLKLLLDTSTFRVTREASDVDALELMHSADAPPSLILMSVSAELAHASKEQSDIERVCGMQIAPVVVLANSLSLTQLRSAMRAGASGYLLRDIAADALAQSMALVLAGEKVLPSQIVDGLLDDTVRITPELGSASVTLLPREQTILASLTKGHPNKVIADEMNISESLVKIELKKVLKKVHARNRTEAAIWAVHHGVQQPQL
jgi:two-component system nitrate/nitrite response regulator NarL